MRILFTVHQFFPKYSSGTEVLTFETAKELLNRGHEVRVLAAEPSGVEEAKNNPLYIDDYEALTTYRINYHLGIYPNPVRYEYENPEIKDIVKKVLIEYRPDILHIMHCSRLSAAIIDAAKELNIPVVFTATDFWFVCPISQLRLPDNSTCSGPNMNSTNCLKCYVSKTQPPEVINKVEGIPGPILTLINGIAKYPFVERWEKGVMVRGLVRRKSYMIEQINKVDQIIAPTDIMIKLLTSNGVKKKKIIKLPYGLNVKYISENTPTKKNSGIIKFGFIGTLYEHKGAHILIQAFNELLKTHSNIELNIYGDLTHFPEYVDNLVRLSQGREEIKFLGTFPNSQIGTIFEGIDVLVVPSIWYENTPLVIYSAFNAKTPVIATNLGGMAEVIQNDINGYIFEKEDVQDLKNKMERIVEEKDLLSRLSTGIRPVKSISQNVDEIEEVYKNIV